MCVFFLTSENVPALRTGIDVPSHGGIVECVLVSYGARLQHTMEGVASLLSGVW